MRAEFWSRQLWTSRGKSDQTTCCGLFLASWVIWYALDISNHQKKHRYECPSYVEDTKAFPNTIIRCHCPKSADFDLLASASVMMRVSTWNWWALLKIVPCDNEFSQRVIDIFVWPLLYHNIIHISCMLASLYVTNIHIERRKPPASHQLYRITLQYYSGPFSHWFSLKVWKFIKLCIVDCEKAIKFILQSVCYQRSSSLGSISTWIG